MPRKLTLEEFIRRSVERHGYKYIYNEAIYDGNNVKVKIICPIHGAFYQTPKNHMRGDGCPYCAGNRRLTKVEFIALARAVHGDEYGYDEVEYINNKTPVKIYCKKHGYFWQTPSNHLAGQGCPKCGKERITMTREEFIDRANIVHNSMYDYSKVVYINYSTPVCIICPEHGEFWQTPDKHLHGRGCPHCKQSKMEREVSSLLNGMGVEFIPYKNFDWLGLQSLDFYLPTMNIAIECQGEQHFLPVDFANKGKEWAEWKLRYTQELDRQKCRLCKENGVRLFYINYNEDAEAAIKRIMEEA